ncbi:DUF6538 domain-containing protein [Methylosinus trichosporium]|uniref:DUF6538 domain-containing protein n=1 Tax=Methylosinus TaxID=425 RepID=UPI003B849D78
MKCPSPTHVTRRGDRFYYVRRIPDGLAAAFGGRPRIQRSLRTVIKARPSRKRPRSMPPSSGNSRSRAPRTVSPSRFRTCPAGHRALGGRSPNGSKPG